MSHSLKCIRKVFEPGNFERVIAFRVCKHNRYKIQKYCYLFPKNIKQPYQNSILLLFLAQITVGVSFFINKYNFKSVRTLSLHPKGTESL